jgi:two-component sensor histidine kinase
MARAAAADVWAFAGEISQGVVEGAVAGVRRKLAGATETASVCSVLVELAQNAVHHGASDAASRGELRVEEEPGGYRILAGNAVGGGELAALLECVEGLRGQPREALRRRYRERLRMPRGSSRCAGLGLLEVACRTGGKLELEWSPLDGRLVYVTICARVEKRKGTHGNL